jgi:hypothetical protein
MLLLPRWLRHRASHGSAFRAAHESTRHQASTPTARWLRKPAARATLVVPAVALAGLAVLAAGCGSGTQPRTLPSITAAPTTASPSPSASPSPTPSATCSAAVKKQLSAAVRTYFRVVNSQKQRMDADALAALFTDNCSCQEQVRAIRKTKSQGNRYTQQAKVVELTPSLVDRAHGVVLATFNESAGGVVDGHGKYVRKTSARRDVDRQFHLVRKGDHWLIAQIDSLK